ncbi:MAG TPA: rRNA maturation RNase YbeY [Candidatus Omnitrophica bacterium]|nr:rRNA maturation RNase YbeY [Candidatus Omnitrophota bacterium]
MKIEIVNKQKIKKVNLKKIKKILKEISSLLNLSSKKISFVLSDNRFIKELNKKFFKRNSFTDVISFPLSDEIDKDYLGEVVVSVEEAMKENNWEKELILYLVHGILHLLGFKDKKKKERIIMRKKEEEIMRCLFGRYNINC